MTRTIRRCLVAAVVLGALLATGATPAMATPPGAPATPSAAGAISGPWALWNLHSGMCLMPLGNGTANSTQIIQGHCTGVWPEWWYFEATPVGWQHIESYYNKCLNVQGGSKLDSAHIILYTCASMNDEWVQVKVKSINGWDYYELRNRNSGKCLNIQGGSTAIGANLIQYSCTGSDNELFTWYRNA